MTTEPRSNHLLFRAFVSLMLSALLLPMVISISGCTAIGYAIGHAVDHGKPGRVLPAADALVVRPGAAVTLELAGHRSLAGLYLGRGRVGDDAYRDMWESWRAAHGGPALGDTVQLERESGALSLVFRGFAFRAVELRTLDGKQGEHMAFRSFRALRAGDWSMPTDSLEAMNARGELPTHEALRIATGTRRQIEAARWGSPGLLAAPALPDTVLVPYDDVRHLLLPAPRTATKVGVVVGLTADMIIVAGLVAMATYDPYAGCDMSGIQMGGYATAVPFVTPLEHDWDVLAGREVGALEDDAVAVGGSGPQP